MHQKAFIIILLSSLVLFITACTHTTLKAPCNASGSNCGQKIKINSWSS